MYKWKGVKGVDHQAPRDEYYVDAWEAFAKVIAGVKQVSIVSAGKSIPAYENIFEACETAGIYSRLANLQCEDGKLHEHIFFGRKVDDVDRAVNLVWDATCGDVTRRALQLNLGLLLGHSVRECMDFMDSELGQTCVCDCCGGSDTARKPHDHDSSIMRARRTMQFFAG